MEEQQQIEEGLREYPIMSEADIEKAKTIRKILMTPTVNWFCNMVINVYYEAKKNIKCNELMLRMRYNKPRSKKPREITRRLRRLRRKQNNGFIVNKKS